MKLHWSPSSPFVRKVMTCAHELGLVDRIEKVRSVVAMSSPNPDVMRDNPLNKIPTMILEDGSALFDSVVICEYMDSLHSGPRLFPEELTQRMAALRWHALGNGLLDVLIVWRNERLRPDGQRSTELMNAFGLKNQHALALMEKEADAIAAAPFNIGHVGLICALGYLDFRFADVAWRAKHPKLAAWFQVMSERPSVKATLPPGSLSDLAPTSS